MKNNKGFTLIEIIVVLVILAILAAATIPSMLGFIEDAKRKSMSAEVHEVAIAAQAYLSEKYGTSTERDNTVLGNALTGKADEIPSLSNVLKGDAAGTISNVVVEDGRLKSFDYVQDGGKIKAHYTNGGAVTFDNITSAEPSATVAPTPTATENAGP